MSRSATERDLLAERARLEAAREALAEFEAGLARRRQAIARRDAQRIETAHELERRIRSGSLDGEEADRRYNTLVATLVPLREELDEALDALGAEPEAPTFVHGLAAEDEVYEGLPARSDLLGALVRFEDHRARVVEVERSLRWDRATRLAEDVRRLDRVRVALLPAMTRAHRETVLGLGPEGRAQARRELTQVRLMVRFWSLRTWHALPTLPDRVGRTLARSSTRNEAFFALVFTLLIGFLLTRRAALTERLRETTHRPGQGGWRGAMRPFWPVVGPLVVPLVAVVGLHVLFGLLDSFSTSVMLAATEVLVLGVAWMLIAIDATSRLFVSRLRRGSTKAPTARRVISSTRLVLGYAFACGILLELSLLFVGRGYLHGLVVDLAWLGVLPLALVLIRRWADDVVSTHRRRHPGGFVATKLKDGDHPIKRWLLTLPAAVQLLYEGITTTFKELALRFDQSRRAFAFLFRRRLEKASESSADVSHDWDSLPQELRAAFDGAPVDPELEIGHYPQLHVVKARVGAWKDGGTGFAVALIGERGIGKSSWMRALARECEVDATPIDVPHGLETPADVCRWVAEVLGVEACGTVDELAAQVEESGCRRLLMLDHCQNLVVRAIGGTVALETLVELAARTGASVAWVCSFSRFTWMYLERARQAQDLFSEKVLLEPWPEEQIVSLIRHRMEKVGVEASFQDLVVDQVEGSALDDAVLRTESEYLRLLWDFADGNPRIAMHYWLHSLVPRNGGLRVRLFASPSQEALEALHEQSRFLLAAVVLHENLTLDEGARTVGMSRAECAALFAYLALSEYVSEDEGGQWRLTTHWYRTIIRHLRRRRLLFN